MSVSMSMSVSVSMSMSVVSVSVRALMTVPMRTLVRAGTWAVRLGSEGRHLGLVVALATLRTVVRRPRLRLVLVLATSQIPL